jgi:hypothetical protein
VFISFGCAPQGRAAIFPGGIATPLSVQRTQTVAQTSFCDVVKACARKMGSSLITRHFSLLFWLKALRAELPQQEAPVVGESLLGLLLRAANPAVAAVVFHP